jgi:hypothetical protein
VFECVIVNEFLDMLHTWLTVYISV